LLDGAGTIERLHKCPAGTVATGALAGVNMDDAIINSQTCQGGHDMFDQGNGRVALPDRGAAMGWDDRVNPRGHRRLFGKIGPDKDHARARVGRVKSDRDIGTLKKAKPAHFRRACDRALAARSSEHSLPLHVTSERGCRSGSCQSQSRLKVPDTFLAQFPPAWGGTEPVCPGIAAPTALVAGLAVAL
jgi:hypothetical protein